jgi:hypothetical protein
MKSPGARLGQELEPLPPTHPRPAADDVDDTLQRTVVMCTALGIRVDDDCPCPQLHGAGPSGGDRRGAVHPRRLRRVHIELVGTHHPYPAQPPIRCDTLGGPHRLAISSNIHTPSIPRSAIGQQQRRRQRCLRHALVPPRALAAPIPRLENRDLVTQSTSMPESLADPVAEYLVIGGPVDGDQYDTPRGRVPRHP